MLKRYQLAELEEGRVIRGETDSLEHALALKKETRGRTSIWDVKESRWVEEAPARGG